MKSIMQIPDGRCYLCEMLGNYSEQYTEEHHCIFGSRHKLSERFGLKIYLCAEHHRTGKNAVHNNAKIANLVKSLAQEAFEGYFTDKNFFLVFGKNYKLTPEEKIDAIRELRGE